MDGMGMYGSFFGKWFPLTFGEVGGDDTMRAVPLQDDLPLQESREVLEGDFRVQEFMAHDLWRMEFPGSLNRWDRYHIIPQLAVYTTYIWCVVWVNVYVAFYPGKSPWKTSVLEEHVLELFRSTSRSFSRNSKFYIGGRVKRFVYFIIPKNCGRWTPFWRAFFFKWVGFASLNWLV